MNNITKTLVTIFLVANISACGGGGSSSGGGASESMPASAPMRGERVTRCIDAEIFLDLSGSRTEFTNTCNFDVNVKELDGDQVTGPAFLVMANSTRIVSREVIFRSGACRAPSVPVNPPEDSLFAFSCSFI